MRSCGNLEQLSDNRVDFSTAPTRPGPIIS